MLFSVMILPKRHKKLLKYFGIRLSLWYFDSTKILCYIWTHVASCVSVWFL